jgi:hypothetical protein
MLPAGRVPCLSAQLIYTYDDLNRIKAMEKPDEYIIEYFYDAVGNRTQETITLTAPDFDSDDDGDIDGTDLYQFILNWDRTPQALSGFRNSFGKTQ